MKKILSKKQAVLDADLPRDGGRNEVTWLIGGLAGYGINSSGEMFARCFTRGGLNVFAYLQYPSLIRGGHNSYHIRVSNRPIHSQVNPIDLLVCLNRETFDLHQMNVPASGAILYDPEDFEIGEKEIAHKGVLRCPIPLLKIVKEQGGIDVMRNTVALGASLALLNYPFKYLEELIARQFEHKGEKVVTLNVNMAKAGYDYVLKNHDHSAFAHTIAPTGEKPRILLTGNAAASYGAMQGGCKFYCAYPMTPASSVLTIFAQHDREMNIVVKQSEDELSAVLQAIGAGFAGVRAMVGTSGGGFSLMTEALSMAGMAEVPLVIFESQRPGPGTGLPTWTGQGDLQYLIRAGHDEFPKVVLAPGDVEEAFQATAQALNLADKYHMPVLVVSDQYLSESLASIPDFDLKSVVIERGPLASPKEIESRVKGHVAEDYPRYKYTASGVSPRSLPGMKNSRYVCNSYEHDEVGDLDEEAETREKMHAKRLKKMETLRKDLADPKVYGPKTADISLITWGSTKGPALEAITWLESQGISANLLHVMTIWPFPAEAVKSFLRRAKKTLLIEGNHEAQFGQLIRQFTLQDVDAKFLKWDGRPFYPQEICDKVKSLL